MNSLDLQYQNLLQDILDNGTVKGDRTGTGTRSVFGRQIRHKMSEGFPLLTTKKMAWKQIVTELLWFLRGDTNIKYLIDNNCHIWDGDAYKNFTSKITSIHSKHYDLITKDQFIERVKTDDKFAKEYGELGPIYGAQWRGWGEYGEPEFVEGIDQIANLINDLKTNPDSRRLMVSAWNPVDLPNMVLPPCHYGFQVWTGELTLPERMVLWEKLPERDVMDFPIGPLSDEQYHKVLTQIGIEERSISLMWNQRSVDTFLGLPFNIASYGLLLEIIAKEVNMVPDELIGNLGDVHLYSNHISQAKLQISRELDLEERRAMVTQEMFNQIYNGGGPETLSHDECDQWDIPRVIKREPYKLPTLKIEDKVVWKVGGCLPSYSPSDFTLENYQAHPSIKAPLSN